jgi:hypothetical protein
MVFENLEEGELNAGESGGASVLSLQVVEKGSEVVAVPLRGVTLRGGPLLSLVQELEDQLRRWFARGFCGGFAALEYRERGDGHADQARS